MQEYTDESLKIFLDTPGNKIDLTFINKIKLFEENINNLDELSKSLIFLYLSNAMSLDKIIGYDQDLPNALNYANEAEVHMNDLPDEDDLKSRLFFIKGHIYARLGKAKESHESFVKHIFYLNSSRTHPIVFSKIKSTRKNENLNIPFYSFRTINKYSISDLINEGITLADPITFNDPFDTLLYRYLERHKRIIMEKSRYDIKPMVDAYKHIKVRCFVKQNERELAFENQLMWSHYADSHRGICIRYKFDHDIFKDDPAKLVFSNWYDVDYDSEDKPEHETPKLGYLLASKQKCWKYENEARLIHYDPKYDKEFKQIPLKEIGAKLEAIFFGCKCPEEDMLMIKKIFLNHIPKVSFFKFPNNPEGIWSDIYKLGSEDEERFNKLG